MKLSIVKSLLAVALSVAITVAAASPVPVPVQVFNSTNVCREVGGHEGAKQSSTRVKFIGTTPTVGACADGAIRWRDASAPADAMREYHTHTRPGKIRYRHHVSKRASWQIMACTRALWMTGTVPLDLRRVSH